MTERSSRRFLKSAISRYCWWNDRLTRLGFHWFERLAPFRIEVVNTAENHVNDLMEDLVAILTAFSARLYGQRRGRKKTQAAIQALKESA